MYLDRKKLFLSYCFAVVDPRVHDGILYSLLKKVLLITEKTHKRKIHLSTFALSDGT